MFKRTSSTAKKKQLKVCKTIKINNILLVLRQSTRHPAGTVVPKFVLDVTLPSLAAFLEI